MIVRRSFAAGALALSLLALPAAAQAPADAFAADVTQVIRTKQGALKGPVKDGVAYTLGVPFAAPPLGDLRWKPPAEAPGWTGERDASKAGASCQQVEDCLFLNVVRPAGAKPGAKLPVMFWIHGSAFVVGTSMGAFGADTEGTEFAKKGVIVVSANHRLGRAGWFAHPALTREGGLIGNYGYMDQIAGLKWVKANISAFGGDPANVTVFGESAGAMSALNMMLSPVAKGLFRRVIAQSGFARTTPTSLPDAEANGLKLAEAAGVTGTDAGAAAALRKLPLSALAGPRAGVGAPGRPFPILDGRIIPEPLMAGFAAGREQKIPLIIGGNSNEASLTRPQPALLDAMPAERREAILGVFDPAGSGDKARVVNDFGTVQSITEPDRALARLHAKNGGPTWLYYFSHVPAAETAKKPFGAAHTDEVRFVFGRPSAPTAFTAQDKALSGAMNAYWAAFARKGDPGSTGGVVWPRFEAAKEAQVEFGSEGVQVHTHFLKSWRDFVESIQPK
jgi:para-nitrobenzyl esterase